MPATKATAANQEIKEAIKETKVAKSAIGDLGPNGNQFSDIRRISESRADAKAFISDPEQTHHRVSDDMAEYLGESFIHSVTTGNDDEPDAADGVAPEEVGGSFVETDASIEFSRASPRGDTTSGEDQGLPEAFPTAVRSDMGPSRTVNEALSQEAESSDENPMEVDPEPDLTESETRRSKRP